MTLGLRYRLATLAGVLAIATACSDGAQAPADTLTIHGSGSAAPALATRSAASVVASPIAAADSILSGDPASMSIGMYALYISANEDCSEPILVADYGATAQTKDLAALAQKVATETAEPIKDSVGKAFKKIG